MQVWQSYTDRPYTGLPTACMSANKVQLCQQLYTLQIYSAISISTHFIFFGIFFVFFFCMLLCSGRTHTADNDMTWKTTTAQIYLLSMQNQPLHIRLPCHQPTLSHPKECPTEIWWENFFFLNGCRTSVKWSDRYPTYWPWSEASVSVITGITLWLARPLGPNQKTLVALQTRITLSHSSLRHITKEHRQKHKISSAQWGSCTRLETSIEIPQIASEPSKAMLGNFWEMGGAHLGFSEPSDTILN